MAVTFTSWQDCTVDGVPHTLDWSSDAAVRGRLLWLYAEAIRQAVLERSHVAGAIAFPRLDSEISPDRLPEVYWYNVVQQEVDYIIPWYVNYLDNAGDWHGKTRPPMWSEATLLTAIGAASRLTQGADRLPSAAWCRQQYQILDACRWIREDGFGASALRFFTTVQDATHGHYIRGVDGDYADDAAFLAAWAAAPWSEVGSGTMDAYPNAFVDKTAVPGGFHYQAGRGRNLTFWANPTYWNGLAVATRSYAVSIDGYVEPGPYTDPVWQPDDFDPAWTAGVPYRVVTAAGITLTPGVTTVQALAGTFGNHAAAPVGYSTGDGQRRTWSTNTGGPGGRQNYAVVKYNVAGGFSLR